MEQMMATANFLDEGKPAGGYVRATGLQIDWQNGPLGRGDERIRPNGAFVETVIAAAKQRLEHYQETQFKCVENESAILFLEDALKVLNSRTARRAAAGTEGTHQGN
jgi:hypothetical protein